MLLAQGTLTLNMLLPLDKDLQMPIINFRSIGEYYVPAAFNFFFQIFTLVLLLCGILVALQLLVLLAWKGYSPNS